MKKIVKALSVLILMLSSCTREVVEPSQQITGRYALDDGTGLTSLFLEFDGGALSGYQSTTLFPIAENRIWNCKEDDYDLYWRVEYSIQEGNLFSDFYSGPIKKDGDSITMGSSRHYIRLDGFRDEPYSLISPENTQYEIPLQEGEYSFPVTIENPIPAGELTAFSSDNWITGLTVKDDIVLYRVSTTNTPREGRIILEYTQASDVQVTVKQSPSTFIRLEETSRTIGYAATTVIIPYSIDNPIDGSELTVSSTAEWCQNFVIQSDNLIVSIPDNNSGSSRTARLTFSYAGAQDVGLYLTQEWSASIISMTPSSAQFEYAAGTGSFTFEIQNPREGVTVSATSLVGWITDVSVTDNTVSYKVSENNSGSKRTGNIRISYGSYATVNYTVVQKYTAASIVFTPSSVDFDYNGGTGSFSFEILNPREGASIIATSQVDWITDVEITGNTLSYKVTENNSGGSRTGKIKIIYGTSSRTMANSLFTIMQSYAAPSIVLTPSSSQFDYAGGTGSFSFEIQNPREGVSATATSQANWITDVAITGNTVSYKVSENNSGGSRTGKIRLDYGSANTLFTVKQSWAAPSIVLSSTSAQFEYTAGSGSFSFEIQNPREGIFVTATSQSEWITDVSVGGSAVSFKNAENNSWAQRTGSIEIKYGDIASVIFNVTQKGNSELFPEGAVDLGLSVLWSTCDLGENGLLSSPEEGGPTFACGETETRYSFSWSRYKFGKSSSGPFSKYNTNSSYGTVDNKTVLDTGPSGDDVASKILGGNWRIPTDAEWTELRTKCTWNWSKESPWGMLITAPNGNSIFLRSSFVLYDASGIAVGSYSAYWSSNLISELPYDAWGIYFNSNIKVVERRSYYRYEGLLVRPVSE